MVVFTLIAKVFLLTFCLLSLNSVFESKILVQDVAKYIIQRTDNDVFGVEFRKSCTEQRCKPTSQLGKWCENQSAGQTNEQLGDYSCGCNSPLTTFLPEIGKCMNNSEVLATLQKGCSYYYKSWNNIFLKTLNLANNSTIHHYERGLQSCRLLPESTEYYNEVHTKWERIKTDIFSVYYDSGGKGVVLKWRADSNGKLSGRILRLAVTCNSSNDNRSRTGCILNKVKGKIEYNYLSKRTSTVQESSGPLATVPSLVVSETQQLLLSSSGKEKAVRSTTVIVTAVSILLQPSAMSVLNFSPTRATFSSVTTSAVTTGHIPVGLSSTKSTKSTTNSVPSSVVISASDSPTTGILDQGHKDARKKGNKEEVVIGAAVGAAVVFGVLIIIVIVVSCKCRKPGERKDKKTKLEVKNPVYGKTQNDIQMGKTKGSRESMDQDSQPRCLDIIPESGTMNEGAVYSTLDDYDDQECPAYQSLDKKVQSVAPVYQSLQKEPSLRNPTPKHKLSTTRQPTEKPSVPPDPVYNVLEESNARQGDVSEVLYNVLEGPDPGRDTPSKIQDPVYNVLDGPDAGQTYEAPDFGVQQDPLYNVLEVPESKQEPQEPLYNVLESADAKSASSTQHGPYDGAVSEPLYNVLDGADSDRANVSGAEYAALNRPLSGRDNPAYEQTLEFGVPNAVVHSPGSQRESFYEPLEGSDRQDMYEPLQKKGK